MSYYFAIRRDQYFVNYISLKSDRRMRMRNVYFHEPACIQSAIAYDEEDIMILNVIHPGLRYIPKNEISYHLVNNFYYKNRNILNAVAVSKN